MGLMDLENMFLQNFPHYIKSMEANDQKGPCQFGLRGLDWQDLHSRPLNIVKYISCWPIHQLWAS